MSQTVTNLLIQEITQMRHYPGPMLKLGNGGIRQKTVELSGDYAFFCLVPDALIEAAKKYI
jgi:hypothetical protein